MNLRFVEAFVWVARLRSITRAADKLCITQSAVSSRIASLEQELGVSLLDRRDRGFRLTGPGLRFLDYAERFLALQREVKQELASPEPPSLSIRVGCIETVLHTWLIPLVERLRVARPHLEFELAVEMTHVLNDQLKRGGHDLVFAAVPAMGQGLINEVLPAMEMVFVGPGALGRADPYPLEELLGHEWMTFQRGSQPYMALVDALHQQDIMDKRLHTVSSISALVKLVESGFGLATLPRAAAEDLRRHHAIAILETALPLSPLPLYASHWGSASSPAMEAAIADALDFAREVCQPRGDAQMPAPSLSLFPTPPGDIL